MKTAAFVVIAMAGFALAPALAQNNLQSRSILRATPGVSCQQMMNAANAMHQPSNIDKRDDALLEMDAAKAAQAGGNEAVCQAHMQKVLQDRM